MCRIAVGLDGLKSILERTIVRRPPAPGSRTARAINPASRLALSCMNSSFVGDDVIAFSRTGPSDTALMINASSRECDTQKAGWFTKRHVVYDR